MREIFYVIWIPVLIGGFVWAMVVGFSRSERVECFTWQEYSKTMPGFYLTQWQKQQCDYHGVAIDAPVK